MLPIFEPAAAKNRIGPKKDGGYVVVDMEGFDVYLGCGVGNECGFDNGAIDKFKCPAFCFDGTIKNKPGQMSAAIEFVNKNISSSNNSRETNLDEYFIGKNDIFMKMDIEGSEWKWFSSVSDENLLKIKQMVVEFHGIGNDTWGETNLNKEKILDRLGKVFNMVHIHGNNYAPTIDGFPTVIECTFIRKDCAVKGYSKSSFPIRNLDYPNNPMKIDIAIPTKDSVTENIQKIPKIIHTSWISDDPLPPLQIRCLESWKKILPDYEIKIWTAKNWDVNKTPFSKEAFVNKQWAFVSDVQRLDVLNEFGGIYLDFDVEVCKSFDPLLTHDFFTGTEKNGRLCTPYIMGCKEGNPLIKELLDFYKDKKFIKEDGTFERTANTNYIHSTMLSKGAKNTPHVNEFMSNHFRYPSHMIGYRSPDTYAVHHFCGAWTKLPKGMKTNGEIFDKIYETNKWCFGSGPGSTLEFTKEYRGFLQNFIKENEIKSVVDLGCGDWQFSKEIDWKGVNYIGIDVSSICIKNNIEKYTTANVSFKKADCISDPLPEGDLVILKDVLQHLSNKDVSIVMDRLKKYKYILIVQDIEGKNKNKDIENGQYRALDVRDCPFNDKTYSQVFAFGKWNKVALLKKQIVDDKHVAVIGNGTMPSYDGVAAKIDSFAEVVRMNKGGYPETINRHKHLTGSKMTHYAWNHWCPREPLFQMEKDTHLWLTVSYMDNPLHKRGPEQTSVFKKEGFSKVTQFNYEKDYKALFDLGVKRPTTGLLAIQRVLTEGKTPVIFCFSQEMNMRHYFDNGIDTSGVHDILKEREVLEKWITNGLVIRG